MTHRWGIGEWLGESFFDMKKEARLARARWSTDDYKARTCPFRLDRGYCNKPWGVCSLRPYEDDGGLARLPASAEDQLRIVCPNRFEENGEIIRWIGREILGTPTPRIAREVGFLKSEITGKLAGRIDMVLVKEKSSGAFDWCGLEIQAVYFSGRKIPQDIEAVRGACRGSAPFPMGQRRPDDRSSGPKRLMPQLQIKVPTLRRWKKKMAIVVDRGFFNSLTEMEPAPDLASGDIVWFVVYLKQGRDKRFRLKKDRIHITTLEHATESFTAAGAIPQSEFEAILRKKARYL